VADQAQMGELFGKDTRTVNEHLRDIFEERELDATATIRKFRIVRREGVTLMRWTGVGIAFPI
jgi:hypothetical protein